MTTHRTYEAVLLADLERKVASIVAGFAPKQSFDARLSVLEGAAARLGGFSVASYQSTFQVDPLLRTDQLEKAGAVIAASLSNCGMHPSLALSALAREPISRDALKTTGAHHTDHRLAMLLGRQAAVLNEERRPIVDPACGAGMLLVASALALHGSDRRGMAAWMEHGVHAMDLSKAALRATRLALASLTDDLSVVARMSSRWATGDSLLRPFDEWNMPSEGFGAVVANPPWEKVKLTRHERALAAGIERKYGQSYGSGDLKKVVGDTEMVRSHAAELSKLYPAASSGEMDLYAAFTELMTRLSGERGAIAAYVPAGLIRSKSTMMLRELLLHRFKQVDMTLLDNRPRFFAIDSRFKFLLIAAGGSTSPRAGRKLALSHTHAVEGQIVSSRPVVMTHAKLRSIRPDFTVPEVRSAAEWRLFQRLSTAGRAGVMEPPWNGTFAREVDMTKDRPNFLSHDASASVPLVEGRMVQHGRIGAKSYVSGEGRSALWSSNPIGASRMEPQHWIPTSKLSQGALDRSGRLRVGFCDIAGQTNERSMTAAIIPAGVACGNKVPTILFEDDGDGRKARLWTGLANSFAFDWALRRVLTTTVNYFLLESVPLPPIDPETLPGRRIVDAITRIEELDRSRQADAAWRVAEQRVLIDMLCFRSYGLSPSEVRLILEDFPLLDRSQPKLSGEERSTITADLVLARMFQESVPKSEVRLNAAMKVGAVPYVPSQNAEHQNTARVAN